MLVGTLAYSSLGIDFLGDDYLASAFTTMNSEWLQNHPEDWGVIPEEHYHDSWKDEWQDDWEKNREEDWDESRENGDYSKPELTENGFPALSDPDPDLNGIYSETQAGPDYYIRLYVPDENSEDGEACYYLAEGKGWAAEHPDGELVDSLNGAYYDPSTNTLTLENFTCSSLLTRLMGNGFTIRLTGQNYIDYIYIDSGSVTFEGEGILVGGGIAVDASSREGCVMIKRGVEMNIRAESSGGTILISSTTLPDSLFLEEGVNISGGYARSSSYEDKNGAVCYTCLIYGSEDDLAKEITVYSEN